jgi:hypothetical protein
MGKYQDLLDDVFSVFSDAAWISENIPTYPQNHIPTDPGSEFIRVSIIPSSFISTSRSSLSGQLIIDIFTVAGDGPARPFSIADILDQYLLNKTINTSGNGATQFIGSTMGNGTLDSDNPSLYRSRYTINFNYIGVQ